MAELHYWQYHIHASGADAAPKLVACYLAVTDAKSVSTDVFSGDSYLEDFLRRFYRIDPQAYVRDYPLRAEALLGALLAKRHCAWRFGILSDLTPPAAQAVHPLSRDFREPDHEENGVKLWLMEEGDVIREVPPPAAS